METKIEKSSHQRLRVLISVYACDPEDGSEPGMGGNWVIELARHHDLWILTEGNRYAPALTKFLASRPHLQEHIQVIGIPRQRHGEHLWSHLYYWTYMLWQREAQRIAIDLHRKITFDLVHHLNMIGYREPGYLWKLPIAFLWGPIGGHVQMPWRFLSSLEFKDATHYGMRNILNWIQMRTSIRVRRAMRSADVLIAATHEDQKAIQEIHGRKSVLLNELGTRPANEAGNKNYWDGTRPLRLVWCGHFWARKALNLGLEAINQVKGKISLELHIIGAGKSETLWKTTALRLGLDQTCRWYGMLPYHEAMKTIRSCDAMLFTSVQDATSTSVMEALQFGLPVICHDSCGFGAVVDESCGIKIPMVSPKRSIKGFADALIRLGSDPALLRQLSIGALERGYHLSWENKAKIMSTLYGKALEARSLKSNVIPRL